MINSNGFIVFTVTPELAKQMKGLTSGATYIAQRATAVVTVVNTSEVSTQNTPKADVKQTTTKRVNKKAGRKAASKSKVVDQKVVKKVVKKVAKKAIAKATKRLSLTPDIVVTFVRENEGCNMTDIERSVGHPQATIRRVLNSARNDGLITTEGQRRGLRYFVGATSN